MNYETKAKELLAIAAGSTPEEMDARLGGMKAHIRMLNEIGGFLKDFANQIRREYDEEKRGRP